jgi:hypothetical protein
VIQLPERSVTRFFVPLIDVLILLFCIFLLLPFVSTPADSTAGTDPTAEVEALRVRLKSAEDSLALERARATAARLEKDKTDARRTVVWVIDIDGDTGEMSYAALDGPPGTRFPIRTEQEAALYRNSTRKRSESGAVKYLFVCPRKPSRFPDKKTLENIPRWFAGEAFVIDNPFDRR